MKKGIILKYYLQFIWDHPNKIKKKISFVGGVHIKHIASHEKPLTSTDFALNDKSPNLFLFFLYLEIPFKKASALGFSFSEAYDNWANIFW